METTEAEQVFDEAAEAYRAYWGPIIAPAAVRLLDRVLPPSGRFTLLDVGTGTGALSLAAVERWPDAQVIGVDPSGGMLAQTADEARRRWGAVPVRLRLLTASADRLGLGHGTVDVAVSSFVIQLVPNRAAALREIHRVIRPGGSFACMTWQMDEPRFRPEEVFDDAVDELRIEPPDRHRQVRPYTSAQAAAAEFRRAGFRDVRARNEWLEHQFTPESWLELLEHWMERELFAAQDAGMQQRLRELALRNLRRLRPAAFAWRVPLVSVLAARP